MPTAQILFTVLLAAQNPVSLSDVMQHARAERDHTTLCGPLSLGRLMSLSGEAIDFETLLSRFENRTDEGVQLSEIVSVADSFGFHVEAVEISGENFGGVRLPLILLVDNDMHCLVLESIAENAATVWDPSSMTSMDLPLQVIKDKWNGKAIIAARPDRFTLSVEAGFILMFIGCAILCGRIKRPTTSQRQ